MSNKQRVIYLAGSMEHVTLADAKGWRTRATELLSRYNVKTLDPTRRLHSFKQEEMKRIFELDMRDIRESDMVLVNLNNPEIPKNGTAMEVFYAAYVLRIPVVAFKSELKLPHPFFESLVTEWRSSVDKAVDTIVADYL